MQELDSQLIIAAVIMISLTLYALKGGADYGGGVWDLFSFGKRKEEQKELIANAIGPIWEANHVWLILVIVLIFTCFPKAFAVISTALHIPITVLLVGIIFRGSAYSFRTYGATSKFRGRWGSIFAISSLITPILLGVILGAIASGQIIIEKGIVQDGFIKPWLKPFPISVGIFTVILFSYLAAVYLTLETDNHELREDFRKRAIVSVIFSALFALIVFLLLESGAPSIKESLSERWWGLLILSLTFLFFLGALLLLVKRKYQLARICAIVQVSLIIWGWGLAQFPYLVEPKITIYNSSAPQITLNLVIIALTVGSIILFPSFYYLYKVFNKI